MSDTTQTGPKPKFDWLRPWFHWRRKRFWLLTAIVVYALAGHLGVPWLVKRSIVGGFDRAGRTATVGKVTFNPWIFRLSVQNVVVTDADGVKVLSLAEQIGDFEARSLFLWAWTFSELRVSGLTLDEERHTGVDTRLLRLVESLKGPETGEQTAESQGLPRLVVDLLAIDDTRVHFVDHAAGDFDTTIGPINIEVRDLRTLPDNQGRQQVSIETAYGDRIEWQGTLSLAPLLSEGHLQLAGASLHDTLSYLDHLLPFGMQLGSVDLDLQYRVAQGDDGLQLSVEGLDLDISNLRARLDGADTDIASLGQIGVRQASLAWPQQQVRVDAIELQNLETSAVLAADGSINLMALLPAGSRESSVTDDQPTPWQVDIGRVSLGGSSLGITDESVQPPASLHLEEASVVLTGIDLRDGTKVPIRAAAVLASGGGTGLEGEVVLFPEFSLDGRLELSDLELTPLETYALPHARIRVDGGKLDLDAQIGIGPDERLQASGRLALAGLDVADAAKGERVAGWKLMTIDSFEADLAAGTVRTAPIAFSEPFGRFHIAEDRSTNLSDLLVDAAAPTEAETAPPLQVAIGGLKFENAALDFSDFSLPLPFRAEIRTLNGTIGALSTQSSQPANVELEGQVNEYGLARIEGAVNAWDFTTQADIGMIFRNLDMSRLTPYTVQFAGYAIEGGRMDMDLRYLIQGGQLKGDNSIVIKELDLGEKVEHPDAGSLPLKLAVALLTDINGVIDIDLPVSGDLNDPTFKISGIVWRALGNLITKAVTAPFRLLGALVGMDSEDFGTLSFTPGRSDLSPPDREQLLKLAEAMQQRPELSLKVGGVVAPGVDRPALQAQRLDQALAAKTAELSAAGKPGLDQARLAMEALYTAQFPGEDLAALVSELTREASTEGDPAVFDEPAYLARLREQLLSAQVVSDEDLGALAQARADAVVITLSGEPGLNVVRAQAGEVEPSGSGNVPLELAVEAE